MSSHFTSSAFAGTHFQSTHFGGIEVIIVPIRRGGSSGGMPMPPRKYEINTLEELEQIREQILKEDEEIIQVIVAAIRFIQ